jgi:hypothetical protein
VRAEGAEQLGKARRGERAAVVRLLLVRVRVGVGVRVRVRVRVRDRF